MSAIDPNEINSFDDISTDKAKSDKTLEKSMYFILNLCAKFSLKSQPSIYGKYGKRIL